MEAMVTSFVDFLSFFVFEGYFMVLKHMLTKIFAFLYKITRAEISTETAKKQQQQ